MADKKRERDERLAKALRDNLKRRKAYKPPAVPSKAETLGPEDAGD